jgi:hypothetical protein
MENTANVGLFAVHKVYAYMEKTQRDSWRIRRIRQETTMPGFNYEKSHIGMIYRILLPVKKILLVEKIFKPIG